MQVGYVTDLQQVGYVTDLEQEGYVTDLPEAGCVTDLQQEGCVSDLQQEGCVTDLQQEGCVTDLQQEGCVTDLQQAYTQSGNEKQIGEEYKTVTKAACGTQVTITWVYIITDIYQSQLSSKQHEQEVAACRCVHIPAVSAHCGQAQTRRW